MARPTKFTSKAMKHVQKLRGEGMPYKQIADILLNEYDITTTAGSLKVKMANLNTPVVKPSVQNQLDILTDQVKALQEQINPPTEFGLTQKILDHMNGEWYNYKSLAVIILGSSIHHNKIRWAINRLPEGVIEKTKVNKAVLVRKVKQ